MSEFSQEVRLEGVKEVEDEIDEEKKENLLSDNAVALTSLESLDDDIIDTSLLNMDDEETWLQQPSTHRSSFFDLHKWLKNDIVEDSTERNNSTKYDNIVNTSIDTRTFTRPKKKGDKASIVVTNGASISEFYNTDKDFDKKIKINWNEEGNRNRDCIPAMLKQSLPVLSSFTLNDQGSLEAFLNISQSKGIDSFINMPEPEFYESFVNITRPPLLHTIISNNPLNHTTGNSTMADSQILTESMMQTSMFNDMEGVNTVHFNDAFLKNFSIPPNSNNLKIETNQELSAAVECNSEITQSKPFAVSKEYDTFLLDTTHLSYTVTTPYGLEGLNTIERLSSEKPIDTDCFPSKVSLNSTFIASDVGDALKYYPTTQEEISLNSTYLTDKMHSHLAPNVSNQCSSSTDLSKEKCQNVMFKTPSSVLESHLRTDFITASKAFDNTELAEYGENSNRHNNHMSKSTFSIDLPTNCYEFHQKSIINGVKSMSEQLSVTNTPMLKYDGSEERSVGRIKSLDKNQKFERIPRKVNSATIRLQKSNPNIASHKLKTARSLSKISHHTDIEYISCQQKLNRGDLPLSSKLKFFKSKGKAEVLYTGDSTESIDSTPSVHSAPDVDDRLSTCSDDSQTLYFKRNMDAEQIFKIAQMQEESLNQESTPKSNKRIMENTWIASEKDLPSPILKTSEIGRYISPSNTIDGEVKTSSPILSSFESLPPYPANVQVHSVCAEKVAKSAGSPSLNKPPAVSQPQKIVENKIANEAARLPTSRPSSTVSGIPRLASRIPAPKFIRTTANITTRIRGQDSNVKKKISDGS